MPLARVIDPVDHTGEGGGFTAAGRPGDQDQPFLPAAEIQDRGRDMERVRVRQGKGDDPQDGGQGTPLLIRAAAEAAETTDRKGEIVVSGI